jgi:hypothetical protein
METHCSLKAFRFAHKFFASICSVSNFVAASFGRTTVVVAIFDQVVLGCFFDLGFELFAG